MRIAALLAFVLLAFASNSLLTRAALGAGRLDAATFTCVRLATGTVALALLARVRPRRVVERGSWASALALAGYAVCFTIAYTRIGAATGALVLFAAVQITMIGWGLVRGERPASIDWIGLALAMAGLIVLTAPGATAPDLAGASLMGAAGACWGAYSLAGRRSRDPLGATAGNFARATVAGVLMLGAMWAARRISLAGLGLAAASGAIASGLGYTVWYTVLPSLPAWRAAVVQLIVPVLTALLASVILSEPVTSRLVIATACVASGVWLTVAPGWHAR